MLLSLGLALAATTAPAHEGAHGVVAERMHQMEFMQKLLKSISRQVNDRAPDRKGIAELAKLLSQQATQIAAVFPEGSTEKPSKVKPAIWTDWQGFTAAAGELQAAADGLAAASAGTDRRALRAAFGRVADSCKSCHQKYRSE